MTRRAFDAYYTPDDVALACVGALAPLVARGASICEPSVGGGAFVRALRERQIGGFIQGVDVDPRAPGLELCELRTVADFRETYPIADWIVGNPPYRDAEEHVLHALKIARVGVALLLRLNFLSGQGRYFRLWANGPVPLHSVHVLAARPSFTGGGTDAIDYGFFVWTRWPPGVVPGPPVVRWVAP